LIIWLSAPVAVVGADTVVAAAQEDLEPQHLFQ
jgi:hypothetical protein